MADSTPAAPAAPSQADKPAGADMAQANQKSSEMGTPDSNSSTSPVNGKVIKANKPEDPNQALPTLDNNSNKMIVVEEDTYEEFYAPGTDRPLYRLLFPKGHVLLESAYNAAVNSSQQADEPVGVLTDPATGTNSVPASKSGK